MASTGPSETVERRQNLTRKISTRSSAGIGSLDEESIHQPSDINIADSNLRPIKPVGRPNDGKRSISEIAQEDCGSLKPPPNRPTTKTSARGKASSVATRPTQANQRRRSERLLSQSGSSIDTRSDNSIQPSTLPEPKTQLKRHIREPSVCEPPAKRTRSISSVMPRNSGKSQEKRNVPNLNVLGSSAGRRKKGQGDPAPFPSADDPTATESRDLVATAKPETYPDLGQSTGMSSKKATRKRVKDRLANLEKNSSEAGLPASAAAMGSSGPDLTNEDLLDNEFDDEDDHLEDEDEDEDLIEGDEDLYDEQDYDALTGQDGLLDEGDGGPEGGDEYMDSFSSRRAMLGGLSSLLAGTGTKVRSILNTLKSRNKAEGNPHTTMIALQDLAELLSIATEDTLADFFPTDSIVKELVAISTGEDGPPGVEDDEAMARMLAAGDNYAMYASQDQGANGSEMMLLASRCIANLVEALPSAASSVVTHGAVPILCSKLRDIEFIDLAEQALSTLEKISQDFPGAVVREGGILAVLNYLDFFSTNVQRTAIQTAANACRSIPLDCYDKIAEVLPLLRNLIAHSDQRIVEQAAIAVCRIVENFRHSPEQLAKITSEGNGLLAALNSILQPSAPVVISPDVFFQVLHCLGTLAKSSGVVSIALLDIGISDTLYQTLTGTSSPSPSSSEHTAQAIEEHDLIIIQNLVRRSKDVVQECLNLICGILPSLPGDGVFASSIEKRQRRDRRKERKSRTQNKVATDVSTRPLQEKVPGSDLHRSRYTDLERRLESLQIETNKTKIQRFVSLLLPLLLEVCSSTISPTLRQRALTAILKMVYYIDDAVFSSALERLPFANFITGVLSQSRSAVEARGSSSAASAQIANNEHTFVCMTLQLAELLLEKSTSLYECLFRREGVFHEIQQIARRPLIDSRIASIGVENGVKGKGKDEFKESSILSKVNSKASAMPRRSSRRVSESQRMEMDASIEESNLAQELARTTDRLLSLESTLLTSGLSDPATFASLSQPAFNPSLKASDKQADLCDLNVLRAREIERQYYLEGMSAEAASKAMESMQQLQKLARMLDDCRSDASASAWDLTSASAWSLFATDGQAVSSHELLASGLIESLLRFLTNGHDGDDEAERSFSAIRDALMISKPLQSAPILLLIKRLQEALSRSEAFEISTASPTPSALMSEKTPTSVLARQLRLKLTTDDEDIPKPFSRLVVAIHAIAPFKALDDYLHPRLKAALQQKSANSRTPSSSSRLSSALSAALRGQVEQSQEGHISPADPPLGIENSQEPLKERRKSSRLASKQADSSLKQDQASPGPDHLADSKLGSAASPELSGTTPPGAEFVVSTDLHDANLRGDLTPEDELIDVRVKEGGGKVEAMKNGRSVRTPSTRPSRITTPRGNADLLEVQHQVGGTSDDLTAEGSPLPKPRMSYASALSAPASDWHLEFYVGEQRILPSQTIYGAIHQYCTTLGEHGTRAIWSQYHTIRFKRVDGPPPESVEEQQPDKAAAALPTSEQSTLILNTLRALHALCTQQATRAGDAAERGVQKIKASAFVNNKLTAKLNRQLEEPLIVASGCLPPWTALLVQSYPFIFPFESRYLYLQSTSFGYSRSMTRWHSQSGRRSSNGESSIFPLLGRLQRQKVRIARDRIFESAGKVFELYGKSHAILEFEYFDEVGTGLGPTLEFYATASRDFALRSWGIWREGTDQAQPYVYAKNGLFPAPLAHNGSESRTTKLTHFKILGNLVAKALLDSRITDLYFNAQFMRLILGEQIPMTLESLHMVDPDLAQSLRKLQDHAQTAQVDTLDELALDFTYPGCSDIELCDGGSAINVNATNVQDYIHAVIKWTLGDGVADQVAAFCQGFSQCFPVRDLRSFTADELVMLFGATEEDWSLATISDAMKADHGFNMDSITIRNLLEVVTAFSLEERRDFLQFLTGSPRLPIGGFKALNPMFTVVRKPHEKPLEADDYLPSVMTCVNYLKLPDYSSKDVMRSRIMTAVKEGSGSFHLS